MHVCVLFSYLLFTISMKKGIYVAQSDGFCCLLFVKVGICFQICFVMMTVEASVNASTVNE